MTVIVGVVWSVAIPPFHVPDETTHFAYTQHLAETGSPPRPVAGPELSTEQRQALRALGFSAIIGQRGNKPIWSDAADERLQEVLALDLRRDDGGGFSSATNNPVLYYALETLPYGLAGSGDVLDRLAAMRLLSALLAGVTVLFTYLFLREVLPSTPWAWSVGALAVAFQPIFGFIAGGVNNDNLMFALAAAFFYALARAFRHGLTPRRGAAVGAALGLGVIAKATLLAFVPAAAFALLWLARRAPERGRALALAAGCAALPVAAYVALNVTVWDRPLWSGTAQYGAGVAGGAAAAGSLSGQLGYVWQLYLPRLPFMNDVFPDSFPLWDTWFQGLVSRFGWLDYSFTQHWIYQLALAIFAGVVALAAAGLARVRGALRARLPELAAYALAAGGLLVAIGVAGYGASLSGEGFEQPRYLLPLLPLYAALVALAARGAGRRLGPAVGAVLVVLAIGHTVFSMLLTVSRYYA